MIVPGAAQSRTVVKTEVTIGGGPPLRLFMKIMLLPYASEGRQPTCAQIAEAEALYRQLNESGVHIRSKYEAYKFWILEAAERAAADASD